MGGGGRLINDKKHLRYEIDVERLEHSLSNMWFDKSGMYMLILMLHYTLH